jgi:hypothetical protein
MIVISLIFSGCTATNSDTQLLGTWSMSEDIENSPYKIVYTFYSNSSFFTGVKNMSSNIFDLGLWGTYSLSDERIKFMVEEQNSTSDLKYLISDDGKTLTLFYEDDVNYDILSKE